jgi:hypothetical protein
MQRLLGNLRSKVQRGIPRWSQQFASGRPRIQGHVLPANNLSAELYNNNGEISVCHKYCTTGGQTAPKCRRSLKSFLQDVSIFLRVNVNEVVTLRLINGDNRDIKALDDAFAVSGLKDLAFNRAGTRALPVALDSWPTYAKLISARERFIVFLDSGAAPSIYPYILSQNDHFIETARDDLKNCDAVPSSANAEGKMYMMNHNAEYSYDAGHCRKPSNPTFYTYYNRADPPPVVPLRSTLCNTRTRARGSSQSIRPSFGSTRSTCQENRHCCQITVHSRRRGCLTGCPTESLIWEACWHDGGSVGRSRSS